MYDDAIGHATLAACYARAHHNTAPWATTSLASSHIALSIWIWEALARHPARVLEPRRALADARGWLGYGDADRGPAYNSTAGAAAQLLLHAAALRLP